MEPKITTHQKLLVSWAIQSLAKTLTERDEVHATKIEVARAKGYLEEFNSSLQPNEVELTEEEVNLSSFLHMMLRKGEDSGASAILYRMVNQDHAKNIWRKFIKKAFVVRRSLCLDPLTSDDFVDVTMHYLLCDWSESETFQEHMKRFRSHE
jgi:hypothetical protein